MAMTKHLQEQLDKHIPKGKWFTKDDVIIITRSSWVLGRLVEEGKITKKVTPSSDVQWNFTDVKYYCSQ